MHILATDKSWEAISARRRSQIKTLILRFTKERKEKEQQKEAIDHIQYVF